MKRQVTQGALLFWILFFLAGCNPFTTNIFSGIDKYKMPDLGDLDEVLGAANDSEFYKKLKDDPGAKAEVLATLEDAYTDPNEDSETRQAAALMATDVYLKTSGTEDTLDNFNDLINDATKGETVYDGNAEGAEVLFKKLFGNPPYPAGTSASSSAWISYQASIKTQLQAFIDAVKPLEYYGANLKAGIPAPPGTNKGDTATKALMVGLTRFITYHIDADSSGGISDPDLNALAYYLADPNDSASLTYNIDASVPPGEENIEYFLKDPANTSNDNLVYVVNDGLNISDLIN